MHRPLDAHASSSLATLPCSYAFFPHAADLTMMENVTTGRENTRRTTRRPDSQLLCHHDQVRRFKKQWRAARMWNTLPR